MKKKRLSGILLSLAMVLGLMPGMSLTAKADSTYDAYLVTEADTATTLQEKVVKFNGYDWYIIKDDSSSPTSPTITLLTKECVGVSDYGTNYTYKGSKIESMLSTYYSQNFTSVDSAVASAILTDPEGNATKLYLLREQDFSSRQAEFLKCSQASGAQKNILVASFTF